MRCEAAPFTGCHATITDPDTDRRYVDRDGEAFASIAPACSPGAVIEGSSRTRHVITGFESLSVARASYDSPQYQVVSEFRRAGAISDFVIVAGVG